MSEAAKFEAYKKKLSGICEENDLTFRFRRDTYPVTLTIRPTGNIAQQMSMLEAVEEEGYTSPDAKIVFTMQDGYLKYKTSQTFTISDALFTKVKNLFINMHTAWMQHFFRTIIENNLLAEDAMPDIPSEEISDAEMLGNEDGDDEETPEIVEFPTVKGAADKGVGV